MSFGSTPPPPTAEPATPVPQPDDPRTLEAQRKAAISANEQSGYSAHLLTGEGGVKEDPNVKQKTLVSGTY